MSGISNITLYGANPEYLKASCKGFLQGSALTVQEVPDGLVMPAQKTTGDQAIEFYAGAYTDQKKFIPESALTRRKGNISGPYPADVLAQAAPDYCAESAVYCGLLNHHFGHFLVEATARLWWGIQNDFCGKYLFQIFDNVNYKPAAQEFFELLGIADQIEFIRKPTVFKTLYLPQAALVFNQSYAREYLLPFEKIRQNLSSQISADSPKKIFLSRTALQNRAVIGQDLVEKWFNEQGYVSVIPEKLLLTQQIKLVLGADEIAGINGSAMHLLLFGKGKKTKTIMRNGPFNATYMMLDGATGTQAEYFFALKNTKRASFGLITPSLLDLEKLAGMLRESGFSIDKTAALPDENELKQKYLASWHAAFAQKIGQNTLSDEALLPALLSHILDKNGPVNRDKLSQILAQAGYAEEAAALASSPDKD
ncbi:MAG: glycosyltransferase family 61 protein [Rhodobacteraceae bacterium]|nr:glycosyltransferase family 61 protein [Paracoccaceae bacterium]